MILTDKQKNIYAWLGALVITAVFLVAAAQTLTTAPRFWFDEGVNLQAARNVAEQGYFNLQTARGVPYDKPYQLLTTGYPVSGLLGLIFTLTGFSLAVARGYMLVWMALLLFGTFWFAKKMFGVLPALFSVLLLATFAPIVFHGKSIIGEIPGLALFLLGLAALDGPETYRGGTALRTIVAGLLLGLAVATKPIYLLLFIAIAFVLFLKRRHYAGGFADWKQRILFWVALAVPLALFVLTILPPDVSFSHLAGIAESYQGRASQGHFFANIFENAKRFFSEDALLYTLVLSGIAAFAV